MTMTESLAIVPRSLDDLELLSKRLAESSLIPAAMRANMPNVLVTIMTGQELGLAPMAALRSIHVIEGKPVLGADAMVAIVIASGKAEYFTRVAESEEAVTYETKRRGDPHPRRCTWTMEMAKHAGLHLKDNWRGYKRPMLAARSKAELARDVYPDVLAGCYTHDELDNPIGESPPPPTRHADAIDAEVVSETATDVPVWATDIDACKSEEALKALAPKLAEYKLPKGSPMHKHYGARLAWLRANPSAVVAAEEVDEHGEIVQKPEPDAEPAA
jgi:hypothetical protein